MPRIGSIALAVALLMIPAATTTVSAAATCAGEEATIETGGGPQLILGTPRRDVIVSKGGDDEIFGRGGNDLICAGSGDDEVNGGGGRDRILGAGGDDRIAGASGDDSINGGPDSDRCTQGGGSGPIRKCERADLAIDVTMPPTQDAGVNIDADVYVTNNGPKRVSYSIVIENDNQDASCQGGLDGGTYPQEPLDPGQQRLVEYENFTCTVEGAEPKAFVTARVVANAVDPVSSNNVDSEEIVIIP